MTGRHETMKGKAGPEPKRREGLQAAVFKVGGEEYGIDIMRIMEIIRPQNVTRIPRAPVFVEGVINLRGKVVPIVDLRKRFGADPSVADPRKVRTVIAKVAGQVLGVVVDEVSEVIRMDASQLEEAPRVVKGHDSAYLHGVGKVGDRLVIILDIEKVLTSDEMTELKATGEIAAGSADKGRPSPP